MASASRKSASAAARSPRSWSRVARWSMLAAVSAWVAPRRARRWASRAAVAAVIHVAGPAVICPRRRPEPDAGRQAARQVRDFRRCLGRAFREEPELLGHENSRFMSAYGTPFLSVS